MIATILVPIDFRVASLNTLKFALEMTGERPVRAVLLHASHLSDSISDLLFYSPARIIREKMTDGFRDGLQVIKNHYADWLVEVEIVACHSENVSVVRQFLATHRVDCIFVPRPGCLDLDSDCFDPIPVLKRSGIPCEELEWTRPPNPRQRFLLTSLFD
jgi:hypothetical protein